MKHIATLLFIVAIGSMSFATTIPLFEKAATKQALPSGISSYKLFIDERYVQEARLSQAFTVPVPPEAFDAGEGIADPALDLEAFSIVGNGAYVVIKTEQGEIPGELPTVKTFKGSLRGVANSLAVLTIEPDGKVSGFIRTAKNTYTIGSVKTASNAAYMTKTSDIPYSADLMKCDMTSEALYDKSAHPTGTARQGNTPLVATQTMKIAIDVDKACYDFFGGSQGDITNYITARFAAISAVYEEEIDVGVELGRIYIYSTPDPFTGGSLQPLLASFTNYWAANNSAVDRTIAHLISKRDLDNAGGAMGLGWLGVLCEKSNGYGVTRIMGNEQFPTVDELVIAHEVGHNVGSYHTHNCTQYVPPIDSCYPAEGGCFPGTKQVIGTIMSYCNQRNFTFHPRTIAVMKEAVANAACLGTLAQIQVKTDSVIFPPLGLNTTKDTTLTALVKNTGSVPLTITSISIDGLEIDSEFYLKSLPVFPKVLAPNATLNLTVAFRPAYGGERYGELRITHNASGAVSLIGLRGIGAVPDPDFKYIELDFGEVYGAGNHDSTIVYVENFGDAPLIISKTEIDGVSASDFSIVSGQAPPNVIIPPNQTGTMTVRFTAKSIGPKSATLWITHNAYDPPDNVDWFDLYADVVALAVRPGKQSTVASLSVSPNPTSDKFSIDITSSEIGLPCSVTLVDQLGRIVATIANEKLSAEGLHTIWKVDPSIADGTYLIIAKVGGSTLSERVIVLR